MFLVNPHLSDLTPPPATRHTPHLSPFSSLSHQTRKHVPETWFHVLQVPLMPNIENTPTWACFRCLAASSPHSLMLDTKNTPPRRVLHVQRSPRPIFDAARRVSPLLVMSNTHFDVARRVNTLVVMLKPNPPYPGHGNGFWAGDPNSTRTRTCLSARV